MNLTGKIIATITLGGALLFLSNGGCEKKITSGEVYDKTYEPARSWSEDRSSFIMVGKVPITQYYTVDLYDDEDYVVHFKEWSEERGKWKTNKAYVSKDIYENIKEGDHFSVDETNAETSDYHSETRR